MGLFPNDKETELLSRVLCSSIPTLAGVYYLLLFLGLIKNENELKMMKRDGEQKENLSAPMEYGFVMGFLGLVFWKNSPIALTAIAATCCGYVYCTSILKTEHHFRIAIFF